MEKVVAALLKYLEEHPELVERLVAILLDKLLEQIPVLLDKAIEQTPELLDKIIDRALNRP